MERDLTTGSVHKSILYFSLPYLLSYLLQALYGMADLFFIGRYEGVDSTTAVSIGSQAMHMITVMIVGLAMGSTVLIGRAIGAKNQKEANQVIGNTGLLFVSASLLGAVILLVLIRPIVSVLSTPTESVEPTVSYLTICFLGVPFITAYNVISSIFRGMGDTKSPMYFIAVACICNIVLDYVLIGWFGMGATGAALGTTISQTVSVLLSILVIMKKKVIPGLSREDFKPRRKLLGEIVKLGIPISVQDGFIQIAFMCITVFANRRGLHDAAAVGIVEKLIGILFLVPSTMLSTVSALAAQNIGAGKRKRAGKVLEQSLMIAVGYGLVIAILLQWLGSWAVSLFTDHPEVIALGNQYCRGYAWDCALAGAHFCFSGYFCAVGKSMASFVHNAISIVTTRIPLSYLAAKYCATSLFPMGCAAPLGSLVSVIICVVIYIHIQKQEERVLQKSN